MPYFLCQDSTHSETIWCFLSLEQESLSTQSHTLLYQLRLRCYFGPDVGTDHVNARFIDGVGTGARVKVEAHPPQLLDLSFEALAEHVVNHGIVHSGALRKHAGQEADLRWDAAAVVDNGPQAHQAVGRPADDEAHADQDSDLQENREVQ